MTTESYQTYSSWNKGIPHSETTKEKTRLSCLKSGVGTWNKDIKKSEEWAEKISKSKIKYFQTHKTWNKPYLTFPNVLELERQGADIQSKIEELEELNQ